MSTLEVLRLEDHRSLWWAGRGALHNFHGQVKRLLVIFLVTGGKPLHTQVERLFLYWDGGLCPVAVVTQAGWRASSSCGDSESAARFVPQWTHLARPVGFTRVGHHVDLQFGFGLHIESADRADDVNW